MSTALVPWALALAAIAVQMAFPFTDGGTLALTAASVVLLAGAALADAAVRHGWAAAATLAAVAGGGGLVAETVGVHTGVPFGGYDYTGTLGPQVLGVPALVPLAWVMMAWPALLVARRLLPGRGAAATTVVGAWALTAWDVFLDPQMVDQGHWRWHHPDPGLPGVADVPLTNFAGWLLVSLLVVGALHRLLPGSWPDADVAPLTVYLWTYFSSVLAHAVFFGRPPVALVGALAMGLVAVPLARSVLREARAAARAVVRARRRRPATAAT